jgi:hypothetical protein
MTWSGLAKLVMGFLLAIALLGAGSYLAVQYVIAEFTKPPARPVFANDKPAQKPKPATATTVTKPAPSPAATASPLTSPSPTPAAVAPSPSPSPTPSPTPTGYQARVIISEGLNLRDKPNRESARVGGVDYDDRVTVLEESPDKEWQRVRVEGTSEEGWIRSGYTERSN